MRYTKRSFYHKPTCSSRAGLSGSQHELSDERLIGDPGSCAEARRALARFLTGGCGDSRQFGAFDFIPVVWRNVEIFVPIEFERHNR